MKKRDVIDGAETIDLAASERELAFSMMDDPGGTCSACHGSLSMGIRIEVVGGKTGYQLLCPTCCEAIGRTAGMVRR
jgi:hypothetical protein